MTTPLSSAPPPGAAARRSPWLTGRPPAQPPRRHLYCFPHSGGLPGEYVRWGLQLPGTQVYGICPPGRGGRTHERPVTDLGTLVRELLAETEFVPPYDLFGHSLGALVVYEVTRELAARGRPLPERLIVSAFPAPHLPRPVTGLADRPDEELVAALHERYGGIPPQLAADTELMAVLLPVFRTDFTLLDGYSHQPGEPLPVPLEVVGGGTDVVTADQLGQWEQHSTGTVRVHRFEGGHFYFREEPTPLLNVLARRT
ncbi:thioesterase II family protein [Streptomyces sp. NBC_00996]|uniref:thioesterase II family protein n=1 Tax=Streptomyces sp. NBC_00996 TaxID=2903710 RepID=UPI003869F672|nr:alpha/beta fold hydrolase [Streptomyces sp. NBC_00996]